MKRWLATLHIAGYTTVSNMKVYNNVMAHNGKSGIILWMAVSDVDIKNNIICQNGRFGLDSYDAHGSGVVLDRNLVFGNASGDYNLTNGISDYSYTLGTTIASAPLFVNSTSAGFDAHLSAGSPAINAALNLSSTFTTDMDGELVRRGKESPVGLMHKRGQVTGQTSRILRRCVFVSWPSKETCRTNSDRRVAQALTGESNGG